MIRKSYSKTGQKCRVTFRLEEPNVRESVHLVGDFNDWDTTAAPMAQRKDGSYSVTITLDAEQDYRFRYLIDGSWWENDDGADAYPSNEHGTDDSLIRA